MFELLQYPFVWRALAGGVVVAILLGWMGVYITSRQMSFIGAGVAHASLAAIAFAILVGISPILTALVFSILLGALLYYFDTKTNVSRDTAIGILFAAGMALGILIMQFIDGYTPELMSFLFGNILTINEFDLFVVVGVGLFLMLLLWIYRRALLFVTVDPDGAYLSGVNRNRIELFMYIFTAMSVVMSIKVVGIVLVTALLIIPAATTKAFVSSFRSFLSASIILSILTVISGMLLSFTADWPSGAAIVLVGAGLFLLSRLFAPKH